jgi:hypothetical protein
VNTVHVAAQRRLGELAAQRRLGALQQQTALFIELQSSIVCRARRRSRWRDR